MKITVLFLALCCSILTACNRSASTAAVENTSPVASPAAETEAPVSVAPVAVSLPATNLPTGAAPAEVTFPFAGFAGIGTRLDDKFSVHASSQGLVYQEQNFTGMPPFDMITVKVNAKRIICSIDLYTGDPQGSIGWSDLEGVLDKKYGKGHFSGEPGSSSMTFGSGRRVVTLFHLNGSYSLTYSDPLLEKYEDQRFQAEHLNQAQRRLSGL